MRFRRSNNPNLKLLLEVVEISRGLPLLPSNDVIVDEL